jgi:hypothetical protein
MKLVEDGVAYDVNVADLEWLWHDPAWRARLIERLHDANLEAIGRALCDDMERERILNWRNRPSGQVPL